MTTMTNHPLRNRRSNLNQDILHYEHRAQFFDNLSKKNKNIHHMFLLSKDIARALRAYKEFMEKFGLDE
jgi:hypothetical protein